MYLLINNLHNLKKKFIINLKKKHVKTTFKSFIDPKMLRIAF